MSILRNPSPCRIIKMVCLGGQKRAMLTPEPSRTQTTLDLWLDFVLFVQTSAAEAYCFWVHPFSGFFVAKWVGELQAAAQELHGELRHVLVQLQDPSERQRDRPLTKRGNAGRLLWDGQEDVLDVLLSLAVWDGNREGPTCQLFGVAIALVVFGGFPSRACFLAFVLACLLACLARHGRPLARSCWRS